MRNRRVSGLDCVRSEHHPEVLALISGGIRDSGETHVSAHLAEGVPFILLQPCPEVMLHPPQMARAIAKQRRYHLCRMRSHHRGLDYVESSMHASRDSERGFNTTGQSRRSSQSKLEV